jgi:hypothetical protein
MVSPKGSVGLLVAICLVGGTLGHARAADASGPAPLLVGTWEAQTNRNAYQIRVSWNPAAGRYEGRLVVQGYASRDVGFPLGELCWTATPTGNPATLGVLEEQRSGRGGRTTAMSWQHGVLYLDRSTPAQLLTSSAVFRRVAEEPGRRPTTGTLSILDAFPSADEVRQKITGRDPLDTAARQFAALKTLADILNGVPTRSQDDRRASMTIYSPYSNGQGLARRQFGPAGEALAQSYLHDERFTNQITHVVFPAVGKYVDAKNKAVAEARAEAQAEAEEKAAVLAAAKARAEAEEVAAAEAARKKVIEVTGQWTGVYANAPALLSLSHDGKKVQLTNVNAISGLPAGAVTWEGTLPGEVIIQGDLPLKVRLGVKTSKRSGRAKALPPTAELTIRSEADIDLTGFEVGFLRGEQLKAAAAFLADQASASSRTGHGRRPGFQPYDNGEQQRHQKRERWEEQHEIDLERVNNPSYNGGCGSDCYGSRPGEN